MCPFSILICIRNLASGRSSCFTPTICKEIVQHVPVPRLIRFSINLLSLVGYGRSQRQYSFENMAVGSCSCFKNRSLKEISRSCPIAGSIAFCLTHPSLGKHVCSPTNKSSEIWPQDTAAASCSLSVQRSTSFVQRFVSPESYSHAISALRVDPVDHADGLCFFGYKMISRDTVSSSPLQQLQVGHNCLFGIIRQLSAL